jgi:hypothetical protein
MSSLYSTIIRPSEEMPLYVFESHADQLDTVYAAALQFKKIARVWCALSGSAKPAVCVVGIMNR